MLTDKTCSKCGLTKTTGDFHRRARSPDGLQAWCKECTRGGVNAYQKRVGRSVINRSVKYGLTIDEVNAMLEIPICQACAAAFAEEFEMKFDHCHEVGHFRGVLCHSCNMACQGRSKEAIERLIACIDYLSRDMERVGE